ncbi:MAG: tetratricopeptide repeat protein [Chloroflexi bacterium]|nr:tetratricopeptide repeat protein [Chloroflexota bacterium]
MEQNNQNITLAAHFLDIGQPERALEQLQNVDSDTIDSFGFWLMQGQALYTLKRYEDARKAIRRGLRIEANAPYLHFMLCNCEARLDRIPQAEDAILTALRQTPENVQFLCRYARLVAGSGQLGKAAALVQKAKQFEPDHPAVAHTEIVIAYLRGDDKTAVRSGHEALKDAPDDLTSHYMLGHAYAGQGKVDQANRHLGTAARLNPQEKEFTTSARASRTWAHWLLLPLRPLYRFGSGKIWLGAIITMFALRALNLEDVSFWFAVVYLIYVIYSWVVPPLLRRWTQRQYRQFRK